MKYKVFISYRRRRSNGGLERAKDLSWRDQAKLPESMRELGYYNGVEYNHVYLDSTVQKLAGYLGKRRHFSITRCLAGRAWRLGRSSILLHSMIIIQGTLQQL